MHGIASLKPLPEPDDAIARALDCQAHLVGHLLRGISLRQVIYHAADFGFRDSSAYHITQVKMGTEPLVRISM